MVHTVRVLNAPELCPSNGCIGRLHVLCIPTHHKKGILHWLRGDTTRGEENPDGDRRVNARGRQSSRAGAEPPGKAAGRGVRGGGRGAGSECPRVPGSAGLCPSPGRRL